MRNLYLVVKADLKNLLTNPMWIFYATLFPMLIIFILGYLTKDSYGNGMTSFDYYGITLMLYSILNSGMTSANAFMEERIKKPNMRIIYACKKEGILYWSKVISSFIFCFGFHVLDMVVMTLIFHIQLREVGLLLLIMGAAELCSVTLGVMLCCIFKAESTTNQILGIVINLVAVFGGLLFSLDGYGAAIRVITRISPAKWISDLAFELIYDADAHLFWPCMLVMGGLFIIMMVVCRLTFRKEDCVC